MDANAKIVLIGQLTAGALTAAVLVALLVSIVRRRYMATKTPWLTPLSSKTTDDRPEMEAMRERVGLRTKAHDDRDLRVAEDERVRRNSLGARLRRLLRR
jgi:hypothetical protein